MNLKTWTVKYQRIDDRETRHPFWKRQTQVEAESRQQAIETVKAQTGYPEKYDHWTASPVR